MTADSHYDVVIIGAGLSGLAAGIRCAQFFKKVVIVESHSKLGGLNSYYHKESRQHLLSNGLHAVTNFNPSSRKWGLGMVLRNLGMKVEDLQLFPAKYPSRITLPGVSLAFDNNPATLEQSVAAAFPSEIDGFRRLVAAVMEESVQLAPSTDDCFAFLARYTQSAELRNALALPILTYGGYREHTIDSRLFAVLFRSLLLEGCASPHDMKTLLETLQARFESLGGELLRRSPVARIATENGKATRVELADGRTFSTERILSSAGLAETGRLCGQTWGTPGTFSVFQWIGVYDRPLDSLGIRDTLHFVSQTAELRWEIPGDRPFMDVLTYSAGDNYAFPEPGKPHFKISCFSRVEEWQGLSDEQYAAQKLRYRDDMLRLTRQLYPAIADVKPLVEDTFTPLTVEHYTGHPGGTIYGGKTKTFDGKTAVPNVFIIGNDQGGMGIVGALTSGVVVTNFNLLL